MSDNSVPVSLSKLEEVVQVVAHNLYAKWAEEGRFDEDQITQYAQYSVDDTVFVINEYMTAVNDIIMQEAAELRIITPESDN